MPDEKHEEIEGVLGEMLGVAQLIEEGNRAPILPEDLRMWAERIKAAVVQERATGNVAKLRDALEKAARNFDEIGSAALHDCVNADALCIVCARMSARLGAALAAPPRNCDVGSPDEQAKRFEALCRRFSNCSPCPVHAVWGEFKEGGTKSCQMIWGQMPFAPAEGGSDA